jgi:hypothetical protein
MRDPECRTAPSPHWHSATSGDDAGTKETTCGTRCPTAPISDRTPTVQHAGVTDLFEHNAHSPAAEQFMRPGSLQWVVRRHGLHFIAPKALAASQPCGLNTRTSEAGLFLSLTAERRGRDTRSPPQLGQIAPSRISAQEEQNVHSNEQIIATAESGGRSTLQHSQLGLS